MPSNPAAFHVLSICSPGTPIIALWSVVFQGAALARPATANPAAAAADVARKSRRVRPSLMRIPPAWEKAVGKLDKAQSYDRPSPGHGQPRKATSCANSRGPTAPGMCVTLPFPSGVWSVFRLNHNAMACYILAENTDLTPLRRDFAVLFLAPGNWSRAELVDGQLLVAARPA